MTDLLESINALEGIADEAEQHLKFQQKAFRLTFDFLQKYYPPRSDEEYWKNATDEIALIVYDNRDNPLIMPMMAMALEYLDNKQKQSEGR